MAGAAGGAMIFFMLLIGSVIVGLYAGAYAAHLFLVTIDGTAAGYDEVTWPDEPYFDWLWKLFYLGWLVTLWLVPLLFYAKLQMRAHTAPVALMHVVVAAVVIAWLVFPITMLSSMGGPSRWFVLYPPALRRIAARSGSMVYFYILSGPVLAAGGLSAALLFFYGPMPFVAIGAAGSAVVLILYARLFGRLALALQAVVIPGEVKRQGRTRYRHSPQVQAAARDPITQGGRARFVQPEDMPPTNAPIRMPASVTTSASTMIRPPRSVRPRSVVAGPSIWRRGTTAWPTLSQKGRCCRGDLCRRNGADRSSTSWNWPAVAKGRCGPSIRGRAASSGFHFARGTSERSAGWRSCSSCSASSSGLRP
ncbi:MAG: hypothetical protein U0746_15630 [Gemmataceae bacterium]